MFVLLRYFALSLASLVTIAFGERIIFALYHQNISEKLGLGDVLHALFWGLQFDLALSATLALLGFFIAYPLLRWLRCSPNGTLFWTTFMGAMVLVILQGADLLYYSEAGRHLGYELKEFANSAGDLARVVVSSFALPVLLQLSLFVPIYLLLRWLFKRFSWELAPQQGIRRFAPEAEMLLILIIAVFFIRGGLTHVPLSPLQAQNIGDNAKATLALNGAYNALFAAISPRTIKPVIDRLPDANDIARVRAMYQGAKPDNAPPKPSAPHPNIVFLFLESWSASYMGTYGYEQTATPFFDELRKRSLSTKGMLAGGHRTTEGMFTSLCSWQNPLGKTVAQSQLQDFQYHCLPRLLREMGYSSAFFQGTNKDTSGTGSFAQLLGFTDSYGKRDVEQLRYPPNSWGIHDPDLYRFALDKMKAMSQPFIVGINTNSTHDISVPPGVDTPFGTDSLASKYLNALRFADSALQDFIQAIEADEQLKDTLFVLVADHTAMPHRDVFQKYSVPFLIYHRDRITPRYIDSTVSQRDIAPTLQAIMGQPVSPWFSGQSLLGDWETHYADYYHQGILGWVEGEQNIELSLGKKATMKCYRLNAANLRREPGPCDARAEPLRQRALSFSTLQQKLLFAGTIRQFADLLANNPPM